MRICLDARNPATGGAYTYIVSLLGAMFNEPRIDHEYIVLYDDLHGPLGLPGVREIVVPGHKAIEIYLWGQLRLATFLNEHEIDLYHGLKHLTAPASRAKTIFTIHSTCQYLFPSTWPIHELAYWWWSARACARRADLLIALSEAERQNLIRYTQADVDKIRIVNLAPQDRFAPGTAGIISKQVKERYGLPDHYILYVGNIYPVKNVEGIVRAYHRLVVNHGIREALVLTGGNVYQSDKVFNLIAKLGIEDRVVKTGFVTDDLPDIYRGARLFVFPSHYEAFCLPPIEAMKSGVPVVSSNAGGVPEVVGDAALKVHPESIDDLSEAMLQVLTDDMLRQDLIHQGLERAGSFSWERCARETVELYDHVLGNGSDKSSTVA